MWNPDPECASFTAATRCSWSPDAVEARGCHHELRPDDDYRGANGVEHGAYGVNEETHGARPGLRWRRARSAGVSRQAGASEQQHQQGRSCDDGQAPQGSDVGEQDGAARRGNRAEREQRVERDQRPVLGAGIKEPGICHQDWNCHPEPGSEERAGKPITSGEADGPVLPDAGAHKEQGRCHQAQRDAEAVGESGRVAACEPEAGERHYDCRCHLGQHQLSVPHFGHAELSLCSEDCAG